MYIDNHQGGLIGGRVLGVYTRRETEAVGGHIRQYFGKVEQVFHELVSTDLRPDI